MDLKIDFIRESHLEFNSGFLHTDKKTGLAEYGPYGRTDPALHPSQIGVGFVGTRATTDLGRQWLEECRRPIETDRTRTRTIDVSELDEGDEEIVSLEALAKDLAPDFIGVGPDTPFATSLVTSDRWCSQFTDRDVKEIVGKSSAIERVERATDLISDHVERVATSTPHPNVIIVAVPDDLWKRADAAPLKDGTNLDLRRGLKARAMKWGVPVQLVKESTLRGQGQGLQDKATRAWNFAIALYFKAGGVPWRSHGLDRDTCYVGVSFFRTEDKSGRQILRSGVAQAFDYLGQGIVLRGQPFEWDSRDHGKVPHLPTEEARDLIVRTLDAYKKYSRRPPSRVVVHKSSRYWGDEHPAFNERSGFFEGIASVNENAQIDLVTLQPSPLRLARIGNYPPLRGTIALLGGERVVIYTHGFTPFFDTYPGVHVPMPWAILEHHGDSGARELASEVLALTKMNVNNAAFADSSPITLAFSRKVSEVLRQVGPEMTVRSEYSFYI